MKITAEDRFRADSLTIIELFQSATYEIPPFQRDYAWTKEQCEDLWGDIEALCEEGGAAHFLGPMVVIRNGKKNQKSFLVIDGQQRLTTLQMIISLIRDHWVEINPGPRETPAGPRPYEETCKSLMQSGPPNWTQTFTPNWHIRSVFFDYVQRELSDKDRKNAEKYSEIPSQDLEYAEELFRAYFFFKEKISSLRAAETELLEEKLLNDVLILRIDAIEIENAFILFETLNNRGLDLTQGDLVKNIIFEEMHEPSINNLSPAMITILQEWDGIVEKVSYRKLDAFLRYFLILTLRKKIQKENISREIKQNFGTTPKIKQFVTTLSEFADLFALIENNDSFDGPFKASLNALFQDLNDLNQATQAVFLLAALRRFHKWDKKEHFEKLSQACRAAEILSFRWLVTGKNAQELENIWRESGIILLDQEKSDQEALDAALGYLQTVLPGDQEFRAELAGRTFKSSRFVRYILSKIENSRFKNSNWVLAGSDRLDVEHVAPQNPDKKANWRTLMAGEISYRNIIYRIGNQTLLNKGLNRSAKNDEYKKKRAHYTNTESVGALTELTRELLESNSAWTQKAVIARSSSLAEEAAKIWAWPSIGLDLAVKPDKAVKKESRRVASMGGKKTKRSSTPSRKTKRSSTPSRKTKRSATPSQKKKSGVSRRHLESDLQA